MKAAIHMVEYHGSGLLDANYNKMRRARAIDEAVRNAYPFFRKGELVTGGSQWAKKTWFADDERLAGDPRLVAEIRAEFARIMEAKN